jgi:hypothetical protein
VRTTSPPMSVNMTTVPTWARKSADRIQIFHHVHRASQGGRCHRSRGDADDGWSCRCRGTSGRTSRSRSFGNRRSIPTIPRGVRARPAGDHGRGSGATEGPATSTREPGRIRRIG